MKSKFHNQALALSRQPWKNLVIKLRNITFEYGFELETKLFEETKKIESKIRFVKQLLIEYTHQDTIKNFQKTILYRSMMALLISLEKDYLLHMKKLAFIKRDEKLKIFPVLNAMMIKAERGNGKGHKVPEVLRPLKRPFLILKQKETNVKLKKQKKIIKKQAKKTKPKKQKLILVSASSSKRRK